MTTFPHLALHHKLRLRKLASGLAIVTLALACFSNAARSQAATLDEVLAGIALNRHKTTNFQGHFVSVVVESPRNTQEKPSNADLNLINGKAVSLGKTHYGYREGKAFSDEVVSNFLATGRRIERTKSWQNGETGYILSDNLPNVPKGKLHAQEHDQTIISSRIQSFLQLERKIGAQYEEMTRDKALRHLRARLDGEETFAGLPCLRLVHDGTGKMGRVWGKVLVCPTRDFKEMFSEYRVAPKVPRDGIIEYVKREKVTQLTQYDGRWFPSQVEFEETIKTADGKEHQTYREVFEVQSLRLNSISDDHVFKPVFSPDTVYFPLEGNYEVVGGDTQMLENKLEQADFSVLELGKKIVQSAPSVSPLVLPRAEDDPANEIALAKPTVKPGDAAPDFTATDMNGKVWKLSDFKGQKNLLLTFFPKCFTGGCANHLSSLRDHQKEFDALDTQILAVSVDSAKGEKGQKAFATQWQLAFPLISDTSRSLSKLFGAAQTDKQLAARMSLFIDQSGTVRWVDTDVKVATHGHDALEKIRKLK